MEWLKRMSDSIDYLEEHMEEKFDIDEVAKKALSSKFHFQRMFHMLTGVTVAEYVRKRRLTLAAQELTTSDVKVIDVALKYGYQTPESFTKAFRKIHGVNPSEVRESGIKLKAYPRISFQIQLKGEKEMNYKIVDKEGFEIIGKGIKVTTENDENFKIIPKFWQESCQNGVCDKLSSFAGDLGLLGVCMEFSPEQKEFTYLIAIEKGEDVSLDDCVVKEIPASTWAASLNLLATMPHAIQDVTKRILSEWFPATGYEHADAPELEVYLPGNPDAEDYRCEFGFRLLRSNFIKGF